MTGLVLTDLFDSKGNKYESPELKYNHSSDLIGKPFSVGETRSFDLLFDAPKGIKANHLIINTWGIDLKGDPIRLKL